MEAQREKRRHRERKGGTEREREAQREKWRHGETKVGREREREP